MTTYTVVGVYEDGFQRYADTFEAESPEDAEAQAQALADDQLIVAGVFEGDLQAVDKTP